MQDVANFDIMAGQEVDQGRVMRQQLAERPSQRPSGSSSNPADDFQEPNRDPSHLLAIRKRAAARLRRRKQMSAAAEQEAFHDVKRQYGGFQKLSSTSGELPRAGENPHAMQIRRQRRANRRRRLPPQAEKEAFHDIKEGYVPGMTQPAPAASGPGARAPSSLQQAFASDVGRYQLFVRRPLHFCPLSQQAMEALQQLPNLPPIDVVHLAGRSLQFPHILNTPTLADNRRRKRFEGNICVEWLQRESANNTQLAKEEADKRRREQRESRFNVAAPRSGVASSVKQRSGINANRPLATQEKKYVSAETIEKSKAQREALRAKILEQGRGLSMPAPLKPRA
jgi:hypothetical protein